jgi:hypothetical protein
MIIYECSIPSSAELVPKFSNVVLDLTTLVHVPVRAWVRLYVWGSMRLGTLVMVQLQELQLAFQDKTC